MKTPYKNLFKFLCIHLTKASFRVICKVYIHVIRFFPFRRSKKVLVPPVFLKSAKKRKKAAAIMAGARKTVKLKI